MIEIATLSTVLRTHFNWNLSRSKCFSQMVIAMIRVKIVNLAEVATAFGGMQTCNANYKRIQRFLSNFELCMEQIAKFIVDTFPLNEKWILVIDRTNWMFGKTDINVFMVSICYNGVAIPLFWMLLNKRGTSSTDERIHLINKVINLFGIDKIQCLLGDREFVGEEWLQYLQQQGIPFIFRIKSNLITTNARGQKVSVKKLFQHLKAGEACVLKGKKKVTGGFVYIAGERLTSGDLRIVITDKEPGKALKRYDLREEIEHLFGCLKTRGFRFEDTHLTNKKRIEKLIAIMAIAFCWSHRYGDLLNEIKPIKRKNHGRRLKIVFKVGYEYLRNLLTNINHCIKEFIKIVNVISNNCENNIIQHIKSIMEAQKNVVY